MQIYAGTSGFSYPEWKGVFYPPDIAAEEMLRFYAQWLSAVEINNTFYRLPKSKILQNWSAQVPQDFRFVLKASRRITHLKRLKDAGEETEYFLDAARVMGSQLGCVLYQLPPFLRKDTPRLKAFIDLLPEKPPAVFEFRHPSWADSDVMQLLAERNFACCISDAESQTEIPEGVNKSWGYLRLRKDQYTEEDLINWVRQAQERAWDTVYVFFKHEAQGPRLAGQFLKLADRP